MYYKFKQLQHSALDRNPVVKQIFKKNTHRKLCGAFRLMPMNFQTKTYSTTMPQIFFRSLTSVTFPEPSSCEMLPKMFAKPCIHMSGKILLVHHLAIPCLKFLFQTWPLFIHVAEHFLRPWVMSTSRIASPAAVEKYKTFMVNQELNCRIK